MKEKLILDLDETTLAKDDGLASIWARLGAYIIDGLIIQLFLIVSSKLLVFMNMYNSDNRTFFTYILGCVFASWLYFILFETSKHQGTIGKIIFKIKVTDFEKNKITIKQASIRFFIKYLIPQLLNIYSIIMFAIDNVDKIGNLRNPLFAYASLLLMLLVCFFAFFNEKRKAFHDIMAKTLVFKKF